MDQFDKHYWYRKVDTNESKGIHYLALFSEHTVPVVAFHVIKPYHRVLSTFLRTISVFSGF